MEITTRATGKYPRHHLKKNVAAAVCERRRSDNRECAGFGRNNGQRNGPPRSRLPAEKIIFERVLVPFKPRAKPRDAGEIGSDNSEIGPAHGR